MEPSTFVDDAVMAFVTAVGKKGIQYTKEKALGILEDLTTKNPSLKGKFDIDEMAEKIQSNMDHVGRGAYNEETLARYLEIPIPDLETLTPEMINFEQLHTHIKLESEFIQWLDDWGYDIDKGTSLIGLRGIEYKPDVYAILNTLHGHYEICVSLVCDKPPDEDRVFALLGKIEAYSEAKHSFSYGDIFLIATLDTEFTPGALNAMALQNEQENYSVIPLDGNDIHTLEVATSAKQRLENLQEKVKQAEEETRRAKIKRSAQKITDEEIR